MEPAKATKKMQDAIDYLWPYAGELVEITSTEKIAQQEGYGADLNVIKEQFMGEVSSLLKEATLEIPKAAWTQSGGKNGIHTEHMGFILTELQYMQRTYPNMTW